MIFSSFVFAGFFLSLIVAVRLVPQALRKPVLLLASYVFYGFWDYRFLALIAVSTVIDFLLGKFIASSTNDGSRKIALALSIVANLGMLGFFKYFNFFVDSFNVMAEGLGWHLGNLNIILPVGISFFTFQTMSYTIDVFRRRIEPVESFSDFALYVAFFPQLVAGPIVRASEFLPQLKRPVEVRLHNLWAGLQIFTIGLFKKELIADNVAPLVDSVFDHPEYFSPGTVWLAVLAYAIQIYADFSGYSDMAIGCARALGFRFNQNFNMPYLATSLQDFWRRWHISLSSWLRDYLYIPLGGSRLGPIRTQTNLIVTMLLGGLWHGASWNFVIWGLLHGLGLAIQRAFRSHDRSDSRLAQFVGWFSTFAFAVLLWVPFRATDTSSMIQILRKLFFVDKFGANWLHTYSLLALAISFVAHFVGRSRRGKELVFFPSPSQLGPVFVVLFVLAGIYLFAPTSVSPFIYFQF